MTQTLQYLIQTADGLAGQFGADCEAAVCDLIEYAPEKSIVYIVNGHVTNRKPGDGPSAQILADLKRENYLPKDRLGLLNSTPDGRLLKSSVLYIRNEKSTRIDYLLTIHHDITALSAVSQSLECLVAPYVRDSESSVTASAPPNVNTFLDSLIRQSEKLIGKPAALMNKEEKIRAIRFLSESGAFLITRSGEKVSRFFGISKFTLYSYMDTSGRK